MTLSLEHVLHGLALLESSKLLPGANYYFRGATPRGLSKVSPKTPSANGVAMVI